MAEHAAIILWESRLFCSADIADLLALPEARVEHLINLAREMKRELRTQGARL